MLSTVLDVVEYLTEANYKCGKSTVYNHVKAGWLPKNSQGKFDIETVDKYAALHLKPLDGGSAADDDLKVLQREKLEAETRRAKAQAEHMENKIRIESEKYIEKELFYGEMAARAAVLKNDLESFFISKAEKLIEVCNGDSTRVPDVIEFCLERFELFLGRYAEDKVWDVEQESDKNATEQ